MGTITGIAAQVISVDARTIRFVVPETAPPGPAQIIFKAEGGTTSRAEATIVPSDFALFRQYDPGPLKAQVAGPRGVLRQNGLTIPARTGDAVVLWGSGLGLSKEVSVTLGGVPQKLLYSGPAPSQPGIDQINFQVATGTPDGCYVPLVVGYGSRTVTSFLSKSDDGTCAHPFGLNPAALSSLDAGRSLQGTILSTASNLSVASAAHSSRQELVRLLPSSWNAGQLATVLTGVAQPESCALASPSFPVGFILNGVILSSQFRAATLANESRVFNLVPPPDTTSVPGVDAPFSDISAPVFAGGPWTLSLTPFIAPATPLRYSLALMEPVRLTGNPLLSFKRDSDQTITWRGDSYDRNASAKILLTWPAADTGPANIACTSPARSGRVTIPAKLLAQVPATAGTLSITVTSTQNLPANSADNPYFVLQNGSSSDTRPVDIQ